MICGTVLEVCIEWESTPEIYNPCGDSVG